eukprot:gene9273-1360_t
MERTTKVQKQKKHLLIIKKPKITIKKYGNLNKEPFQKSYWKSEAEIKLHPYPLNYEATLLHRGIKYQLKIDKGRSGPLFKVKDLHSNQESQGNDCKTAWDNIHHLKGQKYVDTDGYEMFGFNNEPLREELNKMAKHQIQTVLRNMIQKSDVAVENNKIQENQKKISSPILPQPEKETNEQIEQEEKDEINEIFEKEILPNESNNNVQISLEKSQKKTQESKKSEKNKSSDEDSQDLYSIDLREETSTKLQSIKDIDTQESVDLNESIELDFEEEEEEKSFIPDSDESESSKIKPHSLSGKLTNFDNAIFSEHLLEKSTSKEMVDASVEVKSQMLIEDLESQTILTPMSPVKSNSKKSTKSPMVFESPMKQFLDSTSEDISQEDMKSNPFFSQHKLPNHPIEAINKDYQLETFPKISFTSPIVDIAFSNGIESRIAVCLEDQVFIYLLLENNNWICNEFYQTDDNSFTKVIFTSNNFIMLISENEKTSVVEIFKGKDKFISKLKFECKIIGCLTFDNVLIVSTQKDIIKYEFNESWNILQGETILENMNGSSDLKCVSVTSDETKLFALSDCMCGIWDLNTCKLINSVKTYPFYEIINPLIIHESKTKGQEGLMVIFLFKKYDDEQDEDEQQKELHKCGLFFISMTGDHFILKYIYENKSSLTQSQSLNNLQVVSSAINQSNYLSVGTSIGKIYIFNSRTTHCSGILSDLENEKISCCKFHNDLPLFASASENGNLFIYYQEN